MRRLLRGYKALEERGYGSKSTVWRLVKNGKIPAPVKIGKNGVAWFEDEIEECEANLPRVSYAPSNEVHKSFGGDRADSDTDEAATALGEDIPE